MTWIGTEDVIEFLQDILIALKPVHILRHDPIDRVLSHAPMHIPDEADIFVLLADLLNGFADHDLVVILILLVSCVKVRKDPISYCNYNFNDLEEIPPAVVNVCLRLTANMVALAQARKDTPVIQVKEWNVQTVSSNIFSNDLKRDLTPFVHERKSYKGDEIDFFVITGDDDSW